MEPTHAFFDDTGSFQYFGFYNDDPTTIPDGWTTEEVTITDLHGVVWNSDTAALDTDYEALNAMLKAKVLADAEAANAAYVSSAAKPLIYARKAAETDAWDLLDSGERSALTTEQRKTQFPFMYWDSQAFGDSMDAAYDRFVAGKNTSLGVLAQIEAGVQKAYADMTQSTDTAERISTIETAVSSVEVQDAGYLLQEDGFFLLAEDGSKLII